MTRVTALALSSVVLLTVSGAMLLFPLRGTAAPATQDVAVENFDYSPAALTINVGDTVQWTWPASNSILHTVTSDTGAELGSPLQATGVYAHTFTVAGTYAYHCAIHAAQMMGTITVRDVVTPTATNTAAATNTAGPTRTATRTGTATVLTTGAPVATAIITPTHTSGIAPTAAPAQPIVVPATGAAGAGAQLPRAGTGVGDRSAGLEWLSLLSGAAGLLALTAAGVLRERV
ncbi:MAG: plastocyanin/azurin family copper-binding protein [Chloroflexota bacterium]|nr:plastocyanin/azurin family copper-binding protein [Chloroflexota bacterium]